jgi:hypothetical protein
LQPRFQDSRRDHFSNCCAYRWQTSKSNCDRRQQHHAARSQSAGDFCSLSHVLTYPSVCLTKPYIFVPRRQSNVIATDIRLHPPLLPQQPLAETHGRTTQHAKTTCKASKRKSKGSTTLFGHHFGMTWQNANPVLNSLCACCAEGMLFE